MSKGNNRKRGTASYMSWSARHGQARFFSSPEITDPALVNPVDNAITLFSFSKLSSTCNPPRSPGGGKDQCRVKLRPPHDHWSAQVCNCNGVSMATSASRACVRVMWNRFLSAHADEASTHGRNNYLAGRACRLRERCRCWCPLLPSHLLLRKNPQTFSPQCLFLPGTKVCSRLLDLISLAREGRFDKEKVQYKSYTSTSTRWKINWTLNS
jgi:hypothetical protein